MVTYTDVADTLSVDVREAIEREMPCPIGGGGAHLWDHELTEIGTFGVPALRVDDYWRCSYCGQTSHSDPRPAWAIALDREIRIWRAP